MHTFHNGASYIVFVLGFIAAYYLSPGVLFSYDAGWHIMAGKEILEQGTIPYTNSWTHVSDDFRWYNVSWLYDVIIAWLEMHYSLTALVFFKATTFAITLTLLFNLCLSREVSFESAAISTFVTGAVLLSYWMLRPHTITLFFTLLYIYALHRSRTSPKWLYILPPTMLVWCNMHGAFIAGISLIGAHGLETIFKKDWKRFRRLFLTGTLCLPCILLTPLGTDIFTLIQLATESQMNQIITEWQPLIIAKHQITFLFFIVFILTFNIRNTSIPLAEKIAPLIWLFLCLHSGRHLPIFAAICAPFIAYNLNSFNHARNETIGQTIYNYRTRMLLGSLACLTIFLLLTHNILSKQAVFEISAIYPNEYHSIKTAVDFLQTNHPDATIFNHYNNGGLLSYQSDRTLPLFIDGRAVSAYDEDFLQHYIQFKENLQSWPSYFARYNIDTVFSTIADSDKLIEDIISSAPDEWETIYDEDNVIILHKKHIN